MRNPNLYPGKNESSRNTKYLMSVRIAAIKEQAFAGLIISQLQEVGLNPIDISTSGHVALGGAEQYYYIAVVEEEAAKAKEALIDLGYEKYIIVR